MRDSSAAALGRCRARFLIRERWRAAVLQNLVEIASLLRPPRLQVLRSNAPRPHQPPTAWLVPACVARVRRSDATAASHEIRRPHPALASTLPEEISSPARRRRKGGRAGRGWASLRANAATAGKLRPTASPRPRFCLPLRAVSRSWRATAGRLELIQLPLDNLK